MRELNEWTFAADTCRTIQGILTSNPELPFSEARVEEGAGIGRKRRDLTLYGRDKRAVLSGEIKLPDRPDGQSPYSDPLVNGAFEKANAKGLEYFFTWNVNKFVLWRTFEPGKPLAERTLEHFNVTSISRSEEILSSGVQTELRGFLTQFLGPFARILEGSEPILSRPLDEKFIRVLESALELPILQTRFALDGRYSTDRKFARDLDSWMRDDQGWLLSTDPKILRDNLERAAKFSCYVLVNRIVFHQALRRRFPTLRKIRIPDTVNTAEKLRELLTASFAEAKRISKDYETVFDGDFGDSLPFLDDAAVRSWREFVREIECFDFSKIEYDVVGHIFERLISPEERHRYGQHYTRSEIVDLINTFCIREPQASELDPSCGGGTFLVRAYALKRTLSRGHLSHEELLQQIKGIDISAYAAHLATVNLATRDLIDERNYPMVARSDFFEVRRDKPVFHIPLSVHGRGKQSTTLDIGEVDAIVGNPPYVRQELLSKDYKKLLSDLVIDEFPDAKLSGRSDLHCYFWPHATSFLKEGGHYGFLTSSAWMDVEYGFHLQEWLLRHFSILALFESNCEPWFTGARVTTVATLMRREADPLKRAANVVRFVQLRKPLCEVLDGFDKDPLKAAQLLRDFVESQTENLLDDRWRIRVANQHELWEAGCRGGIAGMCGSPRVAGSGAQMAAGGQALFQGVYEGGKWGVYLRSPDIFFDLLDRCGSRLVPINQLAEVRRGITSGADDFFFGRDVTEDELGRFEVGSGGREAADRFQEKWGIGIKETDSVRVIEAGDRSRHLIEAEYLEPYVHGLMAINRAVVRPELLENRILLVSGSPEELKGKHILKYIRWGERQGYNERVTVKARSKSRRWYDVVPERRGEIVWPKLQQYKHVVALNPKRTILNCNLYDLFALAGVKADVLAAVLNSSLVALSRHQFGSYMGREGNQVTEVFDAEMVLVPDVRLFSKECEDEILRAFSLMCGRDSRALPDEFELDDRVALDREVLKAIGYSEVAEREKVLKALHGEIALIYGEIRAAEVRMQRFRQATARRDNASPRTIAEEIWEEFDKSQLRVFPGDFVSPSEQVEMVELPGGSAKVLHDLFAQGALQVDGAVLQLGSKERAEFAATMAELGIAGLVVVPKNDRVCERALETYRRYETHLEEKLRELAEERSADPDIQSRIVRELWKIVRAAGRHVVTQ